MGSKAQITKPEDTRLWVPRPGVPRSGVPIPGVPRPGVPRPGLPIPEVRDDQIIIVFFF